MRNYMIAVIAMSLFAGCGGDKVVQKKKVEKEEVSVDFSRLKREGLALFQKKEYQKAQKRLKWYLQKREGDFKVFFTLGEIAAIQGDLKEGGNYYQKAYQLNSKDHILLKQYGKLLFQMKQYRKGVAILEKGLAEKIDPDLGVLLIAGYGYLVEVDKNHALLRKKVEKIARRSLKEKPGDGGIYTNMGIFYFKTKSIPLAVYIFSIAEKNAPKSPVVLNTIGWFHEQQERPLMAKFYYRKALKQQKDYLPALRNLIRFELNSLNYVGALPLLKQLEKIKAGEERTDYGLALTYLGLRKFDNAIKGFEQLNRRYPKKDLYPLILGDIYYKHLATSEGVIDQPKKQKKYFQLAEKWYSIYHRFHPELTKNGVIMTALTDIRMQLKMMNQKGQKANQKSGQGGKPSKKRNM